MKRKLRFRELAREDLKRILASLRELSVNAEIRLAAEFRFKFEVLRGQPRIGRKRDDYQPGLRTVIVDRFVIFYEFTDNLLVIVRIIPGVMDVNRIFNDGSGF